MKNHDASRTPLPRGNLALSDLYEQLYRYASEAGRGDPIEYTAPNWSQASLIRSNWNKYKKQREAIARGNAELEAQHAVARNWTWFLEEIENGNRKPPKGQMREPRPVRATFKRAIGTDFEQKMYADLLPLLTQQSTQHNFIKPPSQPIDPNKYETPKDLPNISAELRRKLQNAPQESPAPDESDDFFDEILDL